MLLPIEVRYLVSIDGIERSCLCRPRAKLRCNLDQDQLCGVGGIGVACLQRWVEWEDGRSCAWERYMLAAYLHLARLRCGESRMMCDCEQVTCAALLYMELHNETFYLVVYGAVFFYLYMVLDSDHSVSRSLQKS